MAVILSMPLCLRLEASVPQRELVVPPPPGLACLERRVLQQKTVARPRPTQPTACRTTLASAHLAQLALRPTAVTRCMGPVRPLMTTIRTGARRTTTLFPRVKSGKSGTNVRCCVLKRIRQA